MPNEHGLYHVIDAQQFDHPLLHDLFEQADEMQTIVRQGGSEVLRGKIMAAMFYEPSTRTRLSFEAAMLRLGGDVIGTEAGNQFSSAVKGETLADTIRIINGYCDVIVIRHKEAGSAREASLHSAIPVINAGDGPGQHPTQALLDIYTIEKEVPGGIEGSTVVMVGDLLNGRTTHSLAYLLALYEGVRIIFVAPSVVRMRDDVKSFLTERNVPFEETTDLQKALKEADVVYQTRVQKERFGDRVEDYEKAHGKYVIDNKAMRLLKPNAIVMHPLPRVDEINTEVDTDPRAAYFGQAHNGVYIRMALLLMVL